MPPAGLEPAILAGERLQTHAVDRSATEIDEEKFTGQRMRHQIYTYYSYFLREKEFIPVLGHIELPIDENRSSLIGNLLAGMLTLTLLSK